MLHGKTKKYYEGFVGMGNRPLYTGGATRTGKRDGTPYNLYTDGLKIYTTIDSRMQQYAEESVEEHGRLPAAHLRQRKTSPDDTSVSSNQLFY